MIRWCVVLMESMVSVEGLMEPLLEPPSLLSSSNQSIHDSEDVGDCWKVPWSSRSTTQGHRDLVDRTKEEEGMIRLIMVVGWMGKETPPMDWNAIWLIRSQCSVKRDWRWWMGMEYKKEESENRVSKKEMVLLMRVWRGRISELISQEMDWKSIWLAAINRIFWMNR